MKYLIVSCSLNPESKSRILAHAAHQKLKEANAHVTLIDLKDYEIPHCDGDSCYESKTVHELNAKVAETDGIIFAMPIYNYSVGSAAKNFIEVVGKAMNDKVVGMLCAAGGKRSYMAPMHFANSLMLDRRCIILPRYAYATGEDFEGHELVSEEIKERIDELVNMLIRVTKAYRQNI